MPIRCSGRCSTDRNYTGITNVIQPTVALPDWNTAMIVCKYKNIVQNLNLYSNGLGTLFNDVIQANNVETIKMVGDIDTWNYLVSVVSQIPQGFYKPKSGII